MFTTKRSFKLTYKTNCDQDLDHKPLPANFNHDLDSNGPLKHSIVWFEPKEDGNSVLFPYRMCVEGLKISNEGTAAALLSLRAFGIHHGEIL
ncbi:hypothetical protein A4A49_20507 [Nicotiana attenuata]|uniref:Uncharacterized protein n=1 Tax=Nicotiana attenuata TaxID=49451 RepID=A0A314KV50_NICAT|nr:hypothetical protein A4A49_20507 [Nicotiana attenuata]